ncbi:hypothetical protein D3D01_10860 [Haloarcula sp. Atlit-7R]|nr:hypothetical protein D3D01_10860 [Haloarcula sp. Atlit-7R]
MCSVVVSSVDRTAGRSEVMDVRIDNSDRRSGDCLWFEAGEQRGVEFGRPWLVALRRSVR